MQNVLALQLFQDDMGFITVCILCQLHIRNERRLYGDDHAFNRGHDQGGLKRDLAYSLKVSQFCRLDS